MDGYYGFEIIECNEEGVRCQVPIGPHSRQPTGIVHRAVYAGIAEELASGGTMWAVTPNGEVGLGMSNDTSFLRPGGNERLDVVASPLHRATQPGCGT